MFSDIEVVCKSCKSACPTASYVEFVFQIYHLSLLMVHFKYYFLKYNYFSYFFSKFDIKITVINTQSYIFKIIEYVI